MQLRALIIDDEPPARSKIRKFLESRQDVAIVGEAGDGIEAIERILEHRPDLIFLDIQMPRGDGFEVLRQIYPEHKPAVIFTTAYDEFAVRAFEVEALDYLLKPFTAERLHCAIERVIRSQKNGEEITEKVARLLNDFRPSAAGTQRVMVRDNGRMFFVKAAEIEWIEAEEKYVTLHTKERRFLVRQSISNLEAQLTPVGFIRIHRCYLINLEFLQEVIPWSHGDCMAVLKSGAQLNIGRNYKDQLLKAMGER